MKTIDVEKTIESLVSQAPKILRHHPVLFAYLYGSYASKIVHPFSDFDIGIYTEEMSIRDILDLELSLSLTFDEKLDAHGRSEVRIINEFPLSVKGKIVTDGVLIYSRDEEKRIDFETAVRKSYFDFLPVLLRYQNEYLQRAGK